MARTITIIRHGVSCARCGRLLTNKESIERGIGPECWDKAIALQAEKAGSTDFCDIPFAGDVVCYRETGNAYKLHVNIPMHDWQTKRSGFEWGYAGSGPSAFALNILLHFGVPLEELLLDGKYHAFKDTYVATLPREGGTIKGEEIEAWIAEHLPAAPPKPIQGTLLTGVFDEEER